MLALEDGEYLEGSPLSSPSWVDPHTQSRSPPSARACRRAGSSSSGTLTASAFEFGVAGHVDALARGAEQKAPALPRPPRAS